MVSILPIFESEGENECFHLYISKAGLKASLDLYFVVYMVIQSEISLAFLGQFIFLMIKKEKS